MFMPLCCFAFWHSPKPPKHQKRIVFNVFSLKYIYIYLKSKTFMQNGHNSTLLAPTQAPTKLKNCMQGVFRHAEKDLNTPEASNKAKR